MLSVSLCVCAWVRECECLRAVVTVYVRAEVSCACFGSLCICWPVVAGFCFVCAWCLLHVLLSWGWIYQRASRVCFCVVLCASCA